MQRGSLDLCLNGLSRHAGNPPLQCSSVQLVTAAQFGTYLPDRSSRDLPEWHRTDGSGHHSFIQDLRDDENALKKSERVYFTLSADTLDQCLPGRTPSTAASFWTAIQNTCLADPRQVVFWETQIWNISSIFLMFPESLAELPGPAQARKNKNKARPTQNKAK